MRIFKAFIISIFLVLAGSTVVLANPAANVGYIYVGDSRFLYMDRNTNFSQAANIWNVSVEGEGYCWLSTTAAPYIDNIKATNPQITTWYEIYGLGINDLDSVIYYTNFYKQRALTNNIILVSVNPVACCEKADNDRVKIFNQYLSQTGLPYIDTFNYLSQTWCYAYDGIHYTPDTDVYIYNTLSSAVDAYVNKGKK